MQRIKGFFSLAILFFIACTHSSKTHFKGVAMTIPYDVQIAETLSYTKKQKIEKIIEEHFASVNQVYNHWNPHSELSTFNQMDSCEALLLSQNLYDLIQLSKKIHLLSGGRFDPTRYDSIHSLKKGEITETTSQSFFDSLILKGKVALKLNPHLKLDLDALSKGYAVDALATKLKEAGFKNFYIEWGGEIKVAGKPSPSRDWTVAIRHPSSPYLEDAIDYIPLKEEALATSGDYLQKWEKGQMTYSHFVDGKTGIPRPVKDKTIASVTVKAKSCALADALATATMLFDTKEEVDIWRNLVDNELENIKMWIVYTELNEK